MIAPFLHRSLRPRCLPCIILFTVIFFLSTTDVPGQTTDLSKRASKITLKMSKVEVLNLLGPPTWAVIPSDTGDFKIVIPQVAYDLYWKNEDCPPVLVKFDASNQVYGYDDGRDMCGKGANRFEPTSAYTCNKPDRAAYCE